MKSVESFIVHAPVVAATGAAGPKALPGPGGQAAKGGGVNDVFLMTSAEGKFMLIQVIKYLDLSSDNVSSFK